MSPPIADTSQWGGFAEAIAIAYHFKVKIGTFGLHRHSDEVFLLIPPAGPPGTKEAITLLWTGDHYELLIMRPETWDRAQKHASEII